MRVRAQRDSASRFPRELQQVDAQVLAIRIAVNFDSLIQFRRNIEYALPVGLQSKPVVINATSGMTKDLNVPVPQCSKIAFRLIFLLAQRGMETAENHVQPP